MRAVVAMQSRRRQSGTMGRKDRTNQAGGAMRPLIAAWLVLLMFAGQAHENGALPFGVSNSFSKLGATSLLAA
jgi:hypothetical protein